MRKKSIILILISVMLILLAAVLGVKFIPSYEEENKLISCENHIDVNSDMVCDSCNESLPFSDYVEHKNLEAVESLSRRKG